MGGLNTPEKQDDGGRTSGKMNASLNEKLACVEWGEYRYDNFFELLPVKNKLDKSSFATNGKTPVFSSESTNNGIMGYTNINADYIVNNDIPIYVIFGDHTRCFNIATESFCVADNVKILKPIHKFSLKVLMFIISAWKKCISSRDYARHWSLAEKNRFFLPVKNGIPDFDFMESFIAELEAYLSVSGLKNTLLTDDELKALERFEQVEWGKFNLEELFGKSTRGKRLKSEDRIRGNLPFVTAGETDEGISAFISNNVEVFSKNTTTIDMFGSAKYRNYDYGADDHIAVVHTEKLLKYAAIFVTTACHKSAHNGDFSYSRNFYTKDADNLFISLPTKDSQPDFEYMDALISAIQKLVIADIIKFSDEKIKAAKEIIA